MTSLHEAARELRRLSQGGIITPAQVVEHARDPESVLHQYFEWDDTEAARRFRLVQAGNLISRVRVTWKHSEKADPIIIPMYYDVSADHSTERQYAISTGLDGDLLERARANARRDLERTRERYRDIDLLPIATEVFAVSEDGGQQ